MFKLSLLLQKKLLIPCRAIKCSTLFLSGKRLAFWKRLNRGRQFALCLQHLHISAFDLYVNEWPFHITENIWIEQFKILDTSQTSDARTMCKQQRGRWLCKARVTFLNEQVTDVFLSWHLGELSSFCERFGSASDMLVATAKYKAPFHHQMQPVIN